jgi:NhaC family Na+:H+ antiporter
MIEKDTQAKTGRTPSMSVSLLVVGVMIFLILFSAAFFGGKVAAGPLQVSLTLALLFALLVARLHGFRGALIGDAIRSSVNGTLGTVFVLMAIGALIGSLYLAGTVPAFIYYGVVIVSPKFYYVTVFIIAALLAMVIGSSATVAGMIGVAFVGLASITGVSPGITAGAVVSGAVVGFTAARISPGVNLTVNAVGVSVDEYARLAMRMIIPTALISAGIYLVLGLTGGSAAAPIDPSQVQDTISQYFNINLLAFLPIVLLLVLAALRFTAFMSLMLPALFAVALAGFTQHDLIVSLAADPSLSYFQAFLNVGIDTLGSGFHLSSGVEAMDELFAGGGIAGMMNTIWLIMMAASFGAVADHTGMLGRIINPIIERAKGTVSLILVTMLTSMGLNVVMADPYGSSLLGTRMFKEAYQKQRLKPVILAVAMGDSGTALSHIIPWNLIGAVLAGTLGLAVTAWAPYTFVAYLAPVVAFVIISLSKGRMAGGEEDTAIAIDEQVEGLADDLTQLA